MESGVSMVTGSLPGVEGIFFSFKNFKNLSSIIMVLNVLLKGPAYDTKLEANNTSPTITSYSYFNITIELAHLIFSDPKALTNL